MEVKFYASKFGTMTTGFTTEKESTLIAIAVDFGPKGEGYYVAYFADVVNLFNQKRLARAVYCAKVPFDDVLGMTYSEIVKQNKTSDKVVPLKQRIQRIDDFVAKCKYKDKEVDDFLTDKDRVAIGTLLNNRPLVVAKTVDDTITKYKEVVDYAKHPKLAKVKIATTKTLLARDYHYNRIGFLSDVDFIGPWTLIEEELNQKIEECSKNQKFSAYADEVKETLQKTTVKRK